MTRQDILDARETVVQEANKHKWRRHAQRPATSVAPLRHPRLLGPRQWQEALGVCRSNGLVDSDVLSRAAGKEPA